MKINREDSITDSPSTWCCWCCRRSKNFSNSSLYIAEKDEPYEYVVEKLAIKKVPLSLFATPEDLKRLSKTTTMNLTSTTESNTTQKSSLEFKRQPSVTFEKYYKTQASGGVYDYSQNTMLNDDSSHTVLRYDQEEVEKEPVKILPSKILTTAQEEELVAHVLDRHSSLYTTLEKDCVPKNLDNLPRPTKVSVPYTVKQALRKHHNKKLVHQAEVHNVIVESQEESNDDIEPSVKETIQALKFAQKPHLPGVPPKNQRSVKNDFHNDKDYASIKVQSSLRDDYFPDLQTHKQFVYTSQETIESRKVFHNRKHHVEGGHHKEPVASLTGNNKNVHPLSSHLTRPTVLQAQTNTNLKLTSSKLKIESEELLEVFKYEIKQKNQQKMHQQYLEHKQLREQQQEEDSEAVALNKPQTTNQSTNSPTICTCNKNINTSVPTLRDKQQTTDNNPEPNLKWKIIIKHHQDNASFDSDDSSTSTEVDSKPCLNRA